MFLFRAKPKFYIGQILSFEQKPPGQQYQSNGQQIPSQQYVFPGQGQSCKQFIQFSPLSQMLFPHSEISQGL